MSEYQVIARKWRPQRFADVVGQDHLTRTLKNAIVQNRTAHAYLLVGPRGIGKTTTARILAKALNCTNNQNGEPCCKCESCISIASDSSLDVIEIDAASQNSVDSIRLLCEQVTFSPVSSRYRIYIVDEVHMLTKQAWNAFLKTLEEPPPHVKFIFATTEVHKILPTILSRCQRFDLRRIPTHLIVERLALICKSEGITLSQTALEAIARAADGGMRDAQSLLDQLTTFFVGADPSKPIDEEEVFSLFGLTSPREMELLLKSVLHDDRTGLVRGIHQLAFIGRNLETLLDELTEQLRALYIAATVEEADVILETSKEVVDNLRNIAKNTAPERISILLENLTPCAYGLRNALNKQVYLETAILKAMREGHAVRVDDLLVRLSQLRDTGSLKPLEEIPFNPFVRPPLLTHSVSNGEANLKHTKQVDHPPLLDKMPIEETIVDRGEGIADETWPIRKATEQIVDLPKIIDANTVLFPLTPIEEPSPIMPSDAIETLLPVNDEDNSDNDLEEETEEVIEGSIPTISIKKYATPGELWHLVVSDVKEKLGNIVLADFMTEGFPKRIVDNSLHVTFTDEFDYHAFQKVKDALPSLENCVSRITNQVVNKILLNHEHGISNLALTDDDAAIMLNDYTQLMPAISSNAFVNDVKNKFQCQIVDIHG